MNEFKEEKTLNWLKTLKSRQIISNSKKENSKSK